MTEYGEKNKGEWTGKVETRTRKTFLAVGKAWMTISRSTPCFKRRKIFQLRHSQQITVADLVFENTELKKYLLPKRGVNQDTIMYASRGGGWGGGDLNFCIRSTPLQGPGV